MYPLIDISRNSVNIVYRLLNGNEKFKITLNINEWLISFTINKQNFRFKTFLNESPNKYIEQNSRILAWEKLIRQIMDIYLTNYDYLINILNKSDKKVVNVTLSQLCFDYLQFVSKKNKKSTYTKYKQLQTSFLLLFSNYNIDDFKLSNRGYIISLIEKNWKIKYSPKQYNELVSFGRRLIIYLNSNLFNYGFNQEIYNPFVFDYRLKKASVPQSDLHRLYSADDYILLRKTILNKGYIILDLLIDLIEDTHLRINELINLRMRDIDLNNKTIKMDTYVYKTGARISIIGNSTIDKIKKIIEYQVNDTNINDKYLFGCMGRFIQNQPLNESMLNRQFSKIKTELNLNHNYTIYGFKHYANVQKFKKLKEKNLPYSTIVTILKKINGHSNEHTTEIYLRDILNIQDDSTTELINYLYK